MLLCGWTIPSSVTPLSVRTDDLSIDDLLLTSLSLAETMANLLGALGYSLLKMAYLKFLRRLSSKCGETSNGREQLAVSLATGLR